MAEHDNQEEAPQADALAQAADALQTYGSRIDALLKHLEPFDTERKLTRLAFAFGAAKPPLTAPLFDAFVEARLQEANAEDDKAAIEVGRGRIRELLAKAREAICALRNLKAFEKLGLRDLIALIARILDVKLDLKGACALAVAAYFYGLDRLCAGVAPEAA